MTKLMDMVCTFIKTELVMKENGKTIFNMDSEKRFGPITVNMKVITLEVRNMERVYITGKMVPCIMVIGMKTLLKVMETTNGKMAVNTSENGKTTTCTVKEFTLGPTAENTKAPTKWTKNTVSECINGPITESMKATGLTVSNMEEANTFYKTAISKQVNGSTERELIGLMKTKEKPQKLEKLIIE